MNREVVIIGADGLIGSQLAQDAERSGLTVRKGTRRQTPANTAGHFFLDLSYPASGWVIPPDASVAFLLAGETSSAYCRNHSESSRKINVARTEMLAKKFVMLGTRVVFISSNLVFDGTVPNRSHEDKTCPQTEYGRQKAEAERRLLALGDRVTVVRLTKVLGPDSGFLKQWSASLQRNEVINPLSDMIVAPLPLKFVSETLLRLVHRPVSGILQVSAAEDVSYEQVATRLSQRLNVPSNLVRSVKTAQSGLHLEHLPKHSTLSNARLREQLKVEPPPTWSFLD